MKAREHFEFSAERRREFDRALALERWTIVFMLVNTVVIYLAMGTSQAMKAAWVEDALSLLPPVAILIAARFRDRPAGEAYPYGYHRSIHVAFLATALILFVLGAYILYDSAAALVAMERPTIGTTTIFGRPIWSGWIMIAALSYTVVPPLVLGRMKLPIAEATHDKALHADAKINKADWLTGVAGILGIVGIGFGFWWADSVAAIVISLDIVADGVKNLIRVTADMMDQRPTSVGDDEPLTLGRDVADALRRLPWVIGADARLREEGHTITGELYLIPRDGHASVAQIEEAGRIAKGVDWRLHDLVVTLARDLGDGERPV